MKNFDLILRNAHIIDPEQEINEVMDIAFSEGKVAAVENEIVGSKDILTKNLRGLIVTPGFIDMHTHVYWGGLQLGLMLTYTLIRVLLVR